MSQPTPGDVFVSYPLSNVSLNYVQDQKAGIADKMFPVVPVQFQAGIIWEWDLGYLLKNGMKARGPNTETEGLGNKLNQKTYATVVEGLHVDIPDQRRANEVSPIDSDKEATIQLTQQAWQRREITLKTKAFGTGIWTGFSDGTGVASAPGANQIVQWDQATSTPVKDVTKLATLLKLATGIRPNRISMGRPVWDALKYNPDIIDRIKYSSGNSTPTVVTQEAVAALFELDELLISDVVQATNNEGGTLTTSFVIGKEFVLSYAPATAGLDTPSAGYTFAWNGYLGASAYGSRMKKFRVEPIAADRVEIEQAYDQRVLASALGGYYSSVVS